MQLSFILFRVLTLFYTVHFCELAAACSLSGCVPNGGSAKAEEVANATMDELSSDNRTQSMVILNREKKKQSYLSFIRDSIFNRIKTNATEEYNNLNITLKSSNGTQDEMNRFLHLMTGNRTANETIDWSKDGHSLFLSTCLPDQLYQRVNWRRKMVLHFPLPVMTSAASSSLQRSVELKLFKKLMSKHNGSSISSNETGLEDIVVSIHQIPLFPIESSRGRKIFVAEKRVSPGYEGWIQFDVTPLYANHRYVTYNFATEVKALDSNDKVLDVSQVFAKENCSTRDSEAVRQQDLEPRLEIWIHNMTSTPSPSPSPATGVPAEA